MNLGSEKLHSCDGVVVGVDEAGRGALVGNVAAAAVILPKEYDSNLLVDSKTIKEDTRLERAEYIKSIAIDYAIGVATHLEIDELNIHNATLLAMQRAVNGLTENYQEVWIDGKFIPDIAGKAIAFVKGDSLYKCISAASILAKTYRDNELIELDKKHPEYLFAKHKGYPTKKHIELINTYGLIPEYRKTYKPIRNYLSK